MTNTKSKMVRCVLATLALAALALSAQQLGSGIPLSITNITLSSGNVNLLWAPPLGKSVSDLYLEESTNLQTWTEVLAAKNIDGITVSAAEPRKFFRLYAKDAPAVVAVTNIAGIAATKATATPMTMNGTVEPSDATVSGPVVWSVKTPGGTGASFSGNVLSTTAQGWVTVTATIADGVASGTAYTQDFTLFVSASGAAFVPVTDITGVASAATATVPLTLSGTVAPSTATYQTIVWTVQSAGTTGASISGGNTLNTTAAGTVTILATITNGLGNGSNYTKTFTITVTSGVIDPNDPNFTSQFCVVAYADASGNVDFNISSSAGKKYALISTKQILKGDGSSMLAQNYGGTSATACAGQIGIYIASSFGYDSGANMDTYGKSLLAINKIISDWFTGTAGLVTEFCPQFIKDAAVKVSFPSGEYVVDGTANNTGVSTPDPISGTLRAFALSAAEANQWTTRTSFPTASGGQWLRSGSIVNAAAWAMTSNSILNSTVPRGNASGAGIRPALWVKIQ